MKNSRIICTIGAALLLTSCASAPAGSGILGWWAARGERAATRASDAHDAARESLLSAARIEAEKTARSADSLPPSPEASLTQRFAGNTTDILAQAVPSVTAEQLVAVRQLIADLRSEDAKTVAAAERRQSSAETQNATLSRALASANSQLQSAENRASEIAAANARLAGQMLALKWAAAISTGLTIAATLAALAYRANAFGLATSVATGIADLRRKQPGIADLATTALDGGLSRAEQTTIARRVQSILAASA